LGVGTAVPGRKFDVYNTDSNAQLRVSQTGAYYGEVYVDSAGDVQISSTGGNIRQNDENLWICSGGSCGVSTPASKAMLLLKRE